MQPERLARDFRVITRLLQGMPRTGSAKERLDGFYRTQAEDYDRFRERLLGGRQELIESLSLPLQAKVLDLGAGTGSNLLRFPETNQIHGEFVLVDLCPSLLSIARKRWQHASNVSVVEADAAQFDSQHRFDLVLMSYSLSMMPDFEAVIANAHRLLRPGGMLAVVLFFLWPDRATLNVRHPALERWFWSRWFRHDGVVLDEQRLMTLMRWFPSHRMIANRQPVPWLWPLRVPYFRFLGIRTLETP